MFFNVIPVIESLAPVEVPAIESFNVSEPPAPSTTSPGA